MKANKLGAFMIITKEFVKNDSKDCLLKEVFIFSDQSILSDDQSKLSSLIRALENDKSLQLYNKMEHIPDNRDLRMVSWSQ